MHTTPQKSCRHAGHTPVLCFVVIIRRSLGHEFGAMQVDREEGVYNIWIDRSDQPQKKYVGQLSDLQTVDIRSLAGIPVKQLQREFGGRFDGKYTFFPSPEDGLLPPNAPVLKDKVRLQQELTRLWLPSRLCRLVIASGHLGLFE